MKYGMLQFWHLTTEIINVIVDEITRSKHGLSIGEIKFYIIVLKYNMQTTF